MSGVPSQPDLFAAAPANAAPARPLRPPYTLAELEALDRQLKSFDRIPDDWVAGWWEVYDRAYDTIQQAPKAERAALQAVYFDEAERLLRVERETEGKTPAG